MSKHGDMEAIERQIRLWLEKRGIPQQRYENLQPFDKDVLHNLVCEQTFTASDKQLRDLYQNLLLAKKRNAKGDSTAAVDFMTNEDLKKFFRPLTPAERLPDLYKY